MDTVDFRKDVQERPLHTRNRCQSTGVHHVRQDFANEEVVNGKV